MLGDDMVSFDPDELLALEEGRPDVYGTLAQQTANKKYLEGTHLFRVYMDQAGALRLDALKIEKRTPCGAWIKSPIEFDRTTWDQRLRWVHAVGRKRFACPTIQEAVESYVARAKKRIVHLEHALHDTKAALQRAKLHLFMED